MMVVIKIKIRYILAAFIILISIAATPPAIELSYKARGHVAIGGEYLIIPIGLLLSHIIFIVAKEWDESELQQNTISNLRRKKIMAKRVKKNSEFELKNWDDVDRCLREICESELAIGEIEAQMNISINEAKEKASELAKPMQDKIKSLTALVQTFAEEEKSEMEGKTKQLNFGRVSFRQSSSITVPTKKLDLILRNLKKFGMDDCIAVKESVDKEALEKYSDLDIARVGASRTVSDKFKLETDKEKLCPK